MSSFYSINQTKDVNILDFTVQERFDSTSSASAKPHDYEEFIQNGKKHHRCLVPNCGKIFKFKSEITRHLLVHAREKPLQCPEKDCMKSFKRQDALQNHIRIHQQDQRFECTFSDCHRKFITRSALRYHLLKHNNQKEFQCTFAGCNKSFITKSQLKQHEKAEKYHQRIDLDDMEEIEQVKKTIKAVNLDSASHQDLRFTVIPPQYDRSNFVETYYPGKFDHLDKYEATESFKDALNQDANDDTVLRERIGNYTSLIDRFLDENEFKAQMHAEVEFNTENLNDNGSNIEVNSVLSNPLLEDSEFQFLKF